MILIIDNYDSFTYNLVQYIGEVGGGINIEVYRNNEITTDRIKELNPSHIVISPGPCTPNEAGISMKICNEFNSKIPILGVCLGHQAIAQSYGAKIVHAPQVMHGKTSIISHCEMGIFMNIPQDFIATRYHSLVVAESTLSPDFNVTARSEDGEIMAIEHKNKTTIGVQFHPESILTTVGKDILRNFIAI